MGATVVFVRAFVMHDIEYVVLEILQWIGRNRNRIISGVNWKISNEWRVLIMYLSSNGFCLCAVCLYLVLRVKLT